MLVTLKPLSHPDHDDILIDDSLFSIGRHEAAFSAYDQKTLAYLSKRHARIFVEHDQAYVADLGSRNGTRINERPIQSRPQPLQSGDILTFANTLRFEVQLLQVGAGDGQGAAALELVLTPTDSNWGEQSVSVSQFPFLVGSSNCVFDAEEAAVEVAKRFLSRRHAHFFLQGDQLFLEDLGSTNGTYVNGERLQESAQVLKTGDLVRFGSPHCEFTVALLHPQDATAAEAETGAEEAPVSADHTAFISAPDSFLDIFCIEDNEAEEKVEEASDEEAEDSAARTGAQKKIFPKTRRFLQDLREAFREQDARPGGNRKWKVAVVLLLFAGAALTWQTLNSEVRLMREQFDRQHYLEALRLADRLLAENPKDEDTRELARQALIKHYVPLWSEKLISGDHSGAFAELTRARAVSGHVEGGSELLDLLERMTELDHFMRERGDAEAEIDIFSDVEGIRKQLAWWSGDSVKHRQMARVIQDSFADFETLNTRTQSYLRSLGNDESVYFPAIDKLELEITSRLQAGEAGQLTAIFDQFAKQYPRLGGMQGLRRDLAIYLPLEAALRSGDMPRLARALSSSQFATPPFEARAEQLSERLPSAEVATVALEKADAAWRTGELEQAISLLEELQRQGSDSAQIQSRLQRRRQIFQQYRELEGARGKPGYGEHLVALYGRLQAGEDQYLIAKLDSEYQRQSNRVMASAADYWARARESWQRYRAEGGIGGLLRLEESISPEYRQKTRLLKEAHDNVQRAQRLQSTLSRPQAEEMLALSRLIEAEIDLQRRSLEQLSIVLGEKLLTQKLGMLVDEPSN